MASIRIFSGGAAHGLVEALAPAITAATGYGLSGEFSAVGALKSRLLAGETVDCVILTDAIVAELEDKGIVAPGSSAAVGNVETAVAVVDGSAPPAIATAADLTDAMRAASQIYFPDPVQATAGIHFANVLRRLGIYDETASRHRTFPNGKTAMAALAASGDAAAIGCTQATEIVSTSGVRLVGKLPGDTGLSTTYTAGMTADTAHPDAVRWLISALASPEHSTMRRQCGFA